MSHRQKNFPGVADKLSAPGKKSVFERQKAEAEAKRLKEEEETAAVYADFVKSFDNDEDEDGSLQSVGTGRPHPFQGGPAKRHFSSRAGPGGPRMSGPGSLGPVPSSVSRKRTYEGANVSNSRPGVLGFDDDDDDDDAGPSDTRLAFKDSDEEDTKDLKSKDAERANSKPTLHLSNLPTEFTSSVVKALFPSTLKVDSIKMFNQDRPSGGDRRSSSALVTLAQDVPVGDIDSTVSALQNKYLGWGYRLNLSRHLSSAAIGAGMPTLGTMGNSSLPFGAKQAHQGPATSLSRAPPPPGMGRAFAPPALYGPSSGLAGRNGPLLQVEVKPPTDLRQLKLIHKTVENVITHGPEFEALLMSRPSVQREERWSWLWDARSKGGVWYRWRLWDIVTGATQRIKHGKGPNDNAAQLLFQGGAVWQSEERALAFEYDTNISEFVSDSEYDSSEDEDSGDEGRKRLSRLQGGLLPQEQANGEGDEPCYLNPLQKAKLVHLLARLPDTTAKLRRGDIARITAFAIRNASEGADEVAELITRNVHLPFTLTSANPERQPAADVGNNELPDEAGVEKDGQDMSSMKLIALYVISDILSSSSTSGVRHAWRYRQLFEAAIKKNSTFAHLGRLEKDHGWGRLRAEKFKRSVNGVLSLWEGWCAFSAGAQEKFVKDFNEPPLTEQERRQEAQKKDEDEERRRRAASKWKTVDQTRNPAESSNNETPQEAMDIDDDVDGEPMDDDDLDGEPMADDDEDLDGEPMAEDEDKGPDGAPAGNDVQSGADHLPTEVGSVNTAVGSENGLETTSQARTRRPKAEDMFADSD